MAATEEEEEGGGEGNTTPVVLSVGASDSPSAKAGTPWGSGETVLAGCSAVMEKERGNDAGRRGSAAVGGGGMEAVLLGVKKYDGWAYCGAWRENGRCVSTRLPPP